MIAPLQSGKKNMFYGKRKNRKNHLDCQLDTICYPRIAPSLIFVGIPLHS
jgi:hypothetical protein